MTWSAPWVGLSLPVTVMLVFGGFLNFFVFVVIVSVDAAPVRPPVFVNSRLEAPPRR